MRKTKRDTDSKQRIQTLFLPPADSYSLREVATLTGTAVRKLRREVAAGLRDATKVRGVWRFLWRHAVYVAMERWSREIQDALGDDARTVLPPLLALRSVTVRLPEYIIRALEVVAAEEGRTLDDALGFELIEFAGTHLTQVEGSIPGYRQAYLFPGPVWVP